MSIRRNFACIAVALIAAVILLAKVSAEEKNAETQPVGPWTCTSRVESLEFDTTNKTLLVPTRQGSPTGEKATAQLWRDDFSSVEDDAIGGLDGISIARLWPGGKYILAGERHEGRVRLIDRNSLKVVSSTFRARGDLTDLAIAPNGEAIAIGYDDGRIEYIKTQKVAGQLALSNRSKVFSGHTGEVKSVRFISDGVLATCGADGILRIWTSVESQQQNFDLSESKPNSVLLSPDGSALVYTSRDGHVIANLSDGSLLDQTTQAIEAPSSTAWSPDGARALFCQRLQPEPRLAIVNRKGEKECVIHHRGSPRDAAFSRCGQIVAVIGDEQLQLYDSTSGKSLPHQNVDAQGTSLAFSNEGNHLAYGGSAAPIVIRSFPGLLIERRLGHSLDTRCIVFSPNDKLLATGHDDGVIRLWNLNEGNLVAELVGHELHVMSVVFTPDGSALLSSGSDGTVRIWSVRHAREFGIVSRIGPSTGSSSGWCQVSMSTNGERIAVGHHQSDDDCSDVQVLNVRDLSDF